MQRLIASLILAGAVAVAGVGAGMLAGCASANAPAHALVAVPAPVAAPSHVAAPSPVPVTAPSPVAPSSAGARATPQLRLAPSLLGRTLNLQQHLTLQAPGHDQQLDVLLEADATHVQMGMVAMGQVAARLSWDGTTLDETRAPWWPQAVSGSRILSDLQLTLWPVPAIQAALPAGWQLAEDGNVRTLTQGGEVVTVITRQSPWRVELDQRREHFKLRIESRDLGDAPDTHAPTPP